MEQERVEQAARAERAERSARAERALAAIDQLNRLLGVTQDEQRRYQLKAQLREMIAALDAELQTYREIRHSRLEQLAVSMDKIFVPSPIAHYQTVAFLGTGVGSQQAADLQRQQIRDPFDLMIYDRVVGLGRPGFLQDLPRAALDHLLWSVDMLSSTDMRGIGGIRGASIDRLVAHSNGALVAEVLMRRGLIHVRELDILGGDGTLMTLDELAALHRQTGARIRVYATADDPVPLLPMGWQIRRIAEQLREFLPSQRDSRDETYRVLGVTPFTNADGPAVDVHLLSTPYSAERVVENHQYDTYYNIIRWQVLLGEN